MKNDDFEVRLDRQREGSLPLIDVRVDDARYDGRHNDRQEAPLGSLLKQLTGDTAELLRQELALAKSELRDTGTRLVKDATKVAVAAGLALMGGLALTASLVVGLGLAIGNYWLSALIVGVVAVGVGYTMAQRALRDLSTRSLAPTETIASLKADQRWVNREMQELKHDLTDETVTPNVRA